MQSITSQVLDCIPYGAQNSRTRQQLVSMLGVSDRLVRKAIAENRERGEIILNHQNGSGYYRATKDDIQALKQQYRQETSRAMKILKRRKTIRRILKEAGEDV